MASKRSKTYKAEINGVLFVEDGIIQVIVEDVEEPISLADFIADFNNKEVKISVGYKQEV